MTDNKRELTPEEVRRMWEALRMQQPDAVPVYRPPWWLWATGFILWLIIGSAIFWCSGIIWQMLLI
jgi:hypothetical protein